MEIRVKGKVKIGWCFWGCGRNDIPSDWIIQFQENHIKPTVNVIRRFNACPECAKKQKKIDADNLFKALKLNSDGQMNPTEG